MIEIDDEEQPLDLEEIIDAAVQGVADRYRDRLEELARNQGRLIGELRTAHDEIRRLRST